MFEIQTKDGRTIATADTWHAAADIQTAEQNLWGVRLFIVRKSA